MLDRDLAELYGVDTRRLNEQVKRNKERFPAEFMFQLTKAELKDWMSQIAISNKEKMGLRKNPYAFTEQGVAMLSAVLKSETAVRASIKIIKAFVAMRRLMAAHAGILPRLENLERRQIKHEYETDQKLERVFKTLEDKDIRPKQGIFFDGQIYDAYSFISGLIRSAKKSMILMDNYVDDTVLTLLSKRKKGVAAVILTKTISAQLELDLKKHNAQYAEIKVKAFKNSHDRFLILDEKRVYHLGASLKDAGRKWFAFSKIDRLALQILDRLKTAEEIL